MVIRLKFQMGQYGDDGHQEDATLCSHVCQTEIPVDFGNNEINPHKAQFAKYQFI